MATRQQHANDQPKSEKHLIAPFGFSLEKYHG
jgi:hypothetical protein